MTHAELMDLIFANATGSAWLYTDGKHTWTLRADLNVTIREKQWEIEDQTLITEAWTSGFNHSYMFEFDVFYGASYVESFYLVAVDEYRAFMPFPLGAGSKHVKARDYTYARCVDFRGSLHDYMERCDFTPEP